MALEIVSAEASGREERSLEVYVRGFAEGAEVCAAEGFGGYADFEGGGCGECGYC